MISADLVLFQEVCATNLPRCSVVHVGRLVRTGGSDFERNSHVGHTELRYMMEDEKKKKKKRDREKILKLHVTLDQWALKGFFSTCA